MAEMMFRLLRADEIECRIARCTEKGVQLLLYKDARCDMNILDETVGTMYWQRHHTRDNANCIVAIFDKMMDQWVEKEDTGTESNTEAEKGLASDSFKRACTNWGIGRELYTSPFIWFGTPDVSVSLNNKTKKWQSFDTFAVTDIQYSGRAIESVTIVNEKTGVAKVFGKQKKTAGKKAPAKKAEPKKEPAAEPTPQPEEVKVTDAMIKVMQKELERIGRDESLLTNLFKVKALSDMTVTQFNKAMNKFKISPSKEQKDE